MNRSKDWAFVGFVGAMALVAGTGCSKSAQSKQARQPQRTPTFEAAVPGGQQGQQGQQGQYQGQYGQGQTGAGQMGGAQMGQGTGGMGERELCSSLTEHGQLRVENVEGGVAIIAATKKDVEQQDLRKDALHVAYLISPPSGEQHARPTSATDRCPLFDAGFVAARAGVIEQGNEVRILILARDASDLPGLRQQVRQFVSTWQK